jgi:hypothetical protein
MHIKTPFFNYLKVKYICITDESACAVKIQTCVTVKKCWSFQMKRMHCAFLIYFVHLNYVVSIRAKGYLSELGL